MGRRLPANFRFLGGGQEFQEERAHALPPDLYIGPPPRTQTRSGPGTETPGISSELATSAGSARSRSLLDSLDEPWRTIMYALQRKGQYIQTFGTVGLQPQLIRGAESRSYFIIQNTSLANSLFVGVGYGPVVVAGGATGFLLQPNGGNYEPTVFPQGDIWVSASGAGTQWVMAVCVD
jgi:hypothetical protein